MVKRLVILTMLAGIISSLVITSCVHPSQGVIVGPDGNYPADVSAIIMNKCAISGCHNQASYKNANGLLLDTWAHLFDGGDNGAEVIAYSPDYSPLLYITNTDTSNGQVTITPSMPLSTPGRPMAALTKAEYTILKNWVTAGAPDKNGNIPFASNAATRQKIYLTQSGNDLMAVIDGQRKVVMRYFTMGNDPLQIENAHEVEFSSDGNYAYVIFYSGNYVQKIDVTNDKVIANVNVTTAIPPGDARWSIIYVAPGDTALAATNMASGGGFGILNATDMTMKTSDYTTGGGYFSFPHGICSNPGFDTFFVTDQYGNTIVKCAPKAKPHLFIKKVSINGVAPYTSSTSDSSSPNPHQIEMVPDNSTYFVTCQGTNEVRVIDAYTDALLATIPVGTLPQEITVSESKHYMLITCMEDQNANTQPGRKGSIYIIDYNTYQVVKILNGDFYQPHDLCVDEQDGLIYIASTNLNPNGPAPHHPLPGGGRAGWYSVYDLNTLLPADNRRYEVLIDPYAMNARF